MNKLFPTVLSMSLTGAFVIAAVMLARIPLRKAPKIISYCLWAVVGFRLICPFTVDSGFSFIPFETRQFSNTRLLDENISFPATVDAVNQAIGDIANGGLGSINITTGQAPDGTRITTQALHNEYWLLFFSKIWVVGVLVMLLYAVASYVLLGREMRTAIRLEGNIYETDGITSPFVFGILKPKIYIPLFLEEGEREYIVLHERTHIRRCDHIIKIAAYFLLCLHWFNPLVWVGFWLCGVDMELSCDERVLKELDEKTRYAYSRSLLSLATQRRVAGPLAFGEGGVRERVKSVLNFRKPSRAVIAAAVAFVAVLSIGFAVNRASVPNEPPQIKVTSGDVEIFWVVGMNKWNGAIFDRLDNFQIQRERIINRDIPYIKNGREISISFGNNKPDNISLSEIILNEDGTVKWRTDEHFKPYTLNFTPFSGVGTFIVEPNEATALSSNSYDYVEGNTIKGYKMVCEWGNNECEYAFVILGDAAITMTPIIDTVSIIVWKNDGGQTLYSLYDGDVTPAPSELSRGKVFHDIAGLNTALAKYPQDSLIMAHIKQTADFTKDEGSVITESIVLPSSNYSKSTGLYDFRLTTLEEAREIVAERHTGWPDITFVGEDTINYTSPPEPVDVYKFEVVVSGLPVTCAVSKERGIFFTSNNGTWFAFTGLLERDEEQADTVETATLNKAAPETMGAESVKDEVISLLSDMYHSGETLYIQNGVFENERSTITYPSTIIDDESELLAMFGEYEWRANRALSSFSASDFGLFIEIYTHDMERVMTLYGGYDLILYREKENNIPMYYTYIPPEGAASADLAMRLKNKYQ